MDGGMINVDAPFGHHSIRIPQVQAVSQITANTQQDHQLVEMTSFENLKHSCEKRESCHVLVAEKLAREPP